MSDSWDTNFSAANAPVHRKKVVQPVRDDWDDDEDDMGAPEDSQKIWEDANSKAPMPQIVAAPTPSASAPVPASATAMLSQPALRILKRPSAGASTSGPASPPPAPANATLADRQARYDAARQRIFAADASADAAAAPAEPSPPPPPPALGVRISRNPRGPEATPPTSPVAKGFGSRRRSSAPPPRV